MAKQKTPRLVVDWARVFVDVSGLGLKEFGETQWTTIVSAAKAHLDNYGIKVASKKDLALLSLGLYLGCFFIKSMPRPQETPQILRIPE